VQKATTGCLRKLNEKRDVDVKGEPTCSTGIMRSNKPQKAVHCSSAVFSYKQYKFDLGFSFAISSTLKLLPITGA